MKLTSLLVLGLIASTALLSVRAQEADDVDVELGEVDEEIPQQQQQPQVVYRRPSHPLTDLAPPHPDVETAYAFVKHADNNLPIGEEVSIICGFVNNAETAINITGIMGSLNSPMQFSFYVQNFTGHIINETVAPGAEVSLEYRFQSHPLLDPLEWQVALTVFSEDGTSGFTSTFYNQTVNFFEPPQPWDAETVFKYILGLAAVVAGAMFFTGRLTLGQKKTSNVSAEDFDNDWLAGVPTNGNSRSGKKSSKSRSRKN